ncbi:hypothetical protein [Spiroplasma sp. BIUS-1]|uniref:hypothetical protein n=1 Tax=Spiroplasma sp. BIUS-1 TaxID=216964 RepID=UPI001396E846|nr:hypothetical protein [Spiroplasma sp. BIUS-1]QHX36935.1 hypothetical protein SBIUS_v1c06820 [Spiroplasma sp. BIUS-1]
MKINTREIDNTEWITNIFVDKENIYFCDSEPNGIVNTLCYIPKDQFKENLKNKKNIDRVFLAHPNPLISSMEKSSETDVDIINIFENYIQNYIVIDKNDSYISFIKDGKVFTSKLKNTNDLKEFQIIRKLKDSNLIIKKNNELFLTDNQLNEIKKINLDIVDLIEFKNNYVIQKSNEEVVLLNSNFEFLKIIDKEPGFKKIFYLNNKNILISYREKMETYMYNFEVDKKVFFDSSFIKRATMLEENILLVKKMQKNYKRDLLNLLY